MSICVKRISISTARRLRYTRYNVQRYCKSTTGIAQETYFILHQGAEKILPNNRTSLAIRSLTTMSQTVQLAIVP
jgi:hypothetical protein